MNTFQENEYKARINRVMDYIQVNLDKKLSLNELAAVANFSPFHFHRVFTSQTKETLAGFVQRLRIEKAATMLISNPTKSVTEIALDTGFANSASFARLFKSYFSMSATAWRSGGYLEFSKIKQTNSKNCKTDSKIGKDFTLSADYLTDNGGANRSLSEINIPDRRNKMFNSKNTKVEIRDTKELTVAYVRHTGLYKNNEELFCSLWGKLMSWAGPRGLLSKGDFKMICMYHDVPEITDDKNLRLSVCVSVPEDTEVSGEVGKMVIPGGRCAVGRFEVGSSEFQSAWDYMYSDWLPQSGFQPDDRSSYEILLNSPHEHPEHKHIVEICIPVKPL